MVAAAAAAAAAAAVAAVCLCLPLPRYGDSLCAYVGILHHNRTSRSHPPNMQKASCFDASTYAHSDDPVA